MTDPDKTVLVVDDDRTFANALATALRRRGYKPMLAHNYEDAISEAEAWKPARAVVDLRMPGKGGLEVVDELKRKDPDIAVVVLTGFGSIATAVEAVKLGAVNYLTKPADVEDILQAFERTQASLDLQPPGHSASLEEVEWEHLQRVLTECGGNISEAARRLGMHRRSLQRKLSRGRPDGA